MYRSDDGGQSFGALSGPAPTLALAISADGSALYAGSGLSDAKVYRSTDFGATWQERSAGLPSGRYVVDLVAHPADANTLYALVELEGLYRTDDGGLSWARVHPLTGFVPKKLAIDPGAPALMLLASFNGQLQTSADGGATWALDAGAPLTSYAWVGYAPAPAGGRDGAAIAVPYDGRVIHRVSRTQAWIGGARLDRYTIADAAFDPRASDPANAALLIATATGPQFSEDSGMTLAVRSQGIRGASVASLVAARDVEGTIYASYRSGQIGVHRRTLSGWNAVDNAELLSAVPYQFQPVALAVDPVEPLTLVVGAAYALMNSSDGGQSWAGPNSDFLQVLVRSIQFSPSNPQLAYLATEHDGVYRSDNRGVTWIKRSTGLPTAIGVVAVDPAEPTAAYAGAMSAVAQSLVFKTADGGLTWTPKSAGLGGEWVMSLVIDPSNGESLYAGTGGPGGGVFKSANGGESWDRVPISQASGLSFAIDPVVGTTLVMSTNGFGSVARSVDGGLTWESFPPPPRQPRVIRNVLLDPLNPSNVIAGAEGDGLIELQVAPDLSVSFAPAPPATLPLGGMGSATVRVTNRGPFAASAVVLNLAVPAGTAVPVPSPPQGACAQVGSGLACALAGVHSGQQIDIPITVNAGNAPVAGTLSARLTLHETDPAPNDNSVSVPVAIQRVADLGAVFTSGAAAVDHHAPVTLTATATNAGPNASSATQVVIDLGTAFAYQSAVPSKGSCMQSGTTVTCVLGALDPGTSVAVELAGTANRVGSLAASVRVSDSSLVDPAGANDSGTVNVTSRRVADLAIRLTGSVDPVASGQPLQYTVTATNNGPDDVTSAAVTVTVNGVTVTNASTSQGSCSVNLSTINCTLSGLANGASSTIDIGTNAGPAGTATANASVTSSGITDKTSANDTATQSTTVNTPPKSGGGGGIAVGELGALLSLLWLLGWIRAGGSTRDVYGFRQLPIWTGVVR